MLRVVTEEQCRVGTVVTDVKVAARDDVTTSVRRKLCVAVSTMCFGSGVVREKQELKSRRTLGKDESVRGHGEDTVSLGLCTTDCTKVIARAQYNAWYKISV